MPTHAIAVCLSLAVAGGVHAAMAPSLPRPLLELTFGVGMGNTGSLGGEAAVETYAPGEGPVAAPGVRGMGMAQLRPSRAGGPGTTPAGGAVVYDHAGFNGLRAVTLALWFRPAGPNPIARLLYYSNQWDLFLAGSGLGFNLRHDGRDCHWPLPAGTTTVRDGEWHFVAVTHDREGERAALYMGTLTTPPRRVAEWTDVPGPDPGSGPLQIGNLEKIRPFRGSFDSVRVYDRILTEAELSQLGTETTPALPLDRTDACTPPPPALFRHSDVAFSSRGKRKDSLATVAAFRPSRLLWHYTSDAEFVKACRAAGVETVQGAINSIAGVAEPEAQCLDLDGKPVIAPWMVSFDRNKPWYWGCNNRPRFLALSLERAGKALDLGVDWLQFDDWSMIVSAHSWSGACFCDDCMRLFREDLAANVPLATREALGLEPLAQFDYRQFLRQRCDVADAADYKAKRAGLATTPLFEAFQRRSVRRFFTDLRQAIEARAGRPVPLSVNSTLYHPSQRENYLVDLVDFLEGETWQMGLVDLLVPARTAEALGTWQVFSPIPRELRGTRRATATAYALGQLILVPWDIYMGSDATGIKPRYFGTPQEYGALFDFVRCSGELLDGMGPRAMAALVIDLDHPDPNRVAAACRRLLEAGVPFSLVPVGSAYYRAELPAGRLAAMRLILLACERQALPVTDQQALADLAEAVPVGSDGEVEDRDLRQLGGFRIWGPAGIVVLPRAPRQPDPRRLVLHILNHGQEDEVRWLSVIIPPDTIASPVTAARWHAPGQDTQPLEMERLAEGLRLFVPHLGDWAIVELELAAAPQP